MQLIPQANPPSKNSSMLFVDEQTFIPESLKQVAEQLGFKVFAAESFTAALRHLSGRNVDLVLLQAGLSGGDTRDMMARIKALQPQTEIVLTGRNPAVEPVLQAAGNGAGQVLRKPFKNEELRRVLQKIAGRRALGEYREANHSGRDRATGSIDGAMVGQSPEMRRLRRIIERTASSKHPLLILGEKGTGKAMLARLIHSGGVLRGQPFVHVDCGSSSPVLLEGRLFGSPASPAPEQAALTTGGTLFLEAIGEMPLSMQGKLFRALQEKEIRPAGGGKPVPVNVRVIAATCRDLDGAVQQGTFRRDLYLRLNVVALRLPPLRERRDDLPELAEHFLRKFGLEKSVRYSISPDAMKLMLTYDWPGNVGELENALRHAVSVSPDPVLVPDQLPAEIQAVGARSDSSVSDPVRILPLAEVERKAIIDTLNQLNGNKQMAAQLLGIGKTTLYRKLKEYGIGRGLPDRPLGQ